MLKYMIAFWFFYCSFSYAAVDSLAQLYPTLKSEVGRHLCRTLSQRGKLLESIEHSHRFLFTNGHWVKGLHEPKTVNENFLLSPECQSTLFHAQLAQKLLDGVKSGVIPPKAYCKKDPLKRDNFLKRDKKMALRVYDESPRAPSNLPNIFKFEDTVEPNFVGGHRLTVKGKTVYPKVLVSLYEEKEENPSALVSNYITSKWFMPIEQALFSPTLDVYKKNVALLSRWAAYSRFVLMVVPKNTDIHVHVGITAPQSLIESGESMRFINPDKIHKYPTAILERITRARDYLGELYPTDPAKIEENLVRFYEALPGGATQIFVEEVKDYYLFDIDALYYADGSLFSPNFSTAKKEQNNDWKVPKAPRESHFLHDYTAIEIRMHEGLKKLFSGTKEFDEEAEDMKKIVEYYRKFHPV